MLIEQIIEVEWRGTGPLDKYVLLNAVIFTTKQKSPKQILERIFTVLLKIFQEAMHFASSTRAKSLTKFNPHV